MFDLKVRNDILGYCARILWARGEWGRGRMDGSFENRMVGMVAENTLRQLLGNSPAPLDGNDGGSDIEIMGRRLDIKSMGRTTAPRPEFVNNILDVQLDLTTDGYLLCSLNKRNCILTVCGWMPKDEFRSVAILYPAGTMRKRSDGSEFAFDGDTWEIRNEQLYQSGSLAELICQVGAIG